MDFVTNTEGIIRHNNTLQLKKDLKLILESAQSSLFGTHYGRHSLSNELSLVYSLFSPAPTIAFNSNSMLGSC